MLRFLVALVVLLVILVVAVRWIEPGFAFFPSAGETTTPREFGVEYEALSVATGDGEQLRVWRLRPPRPRARVVYFHGNGGNLSVWAPILAGVARREYEVIAFDYRGYGMSSGRPSEQGLYRDVDAIVDRFGSDPRTMPMVYWGRSVGAAMAAYAATRKRPDGVILESGFPDVRSLVRTSPVLAFLALFSSYRFPCSEFLQNVRAPVLVLHGDADTVIPFEQGRKLFDRIPGPKQFVTIQGGDHNDAAPPEPDTYWRSIDQFVATISKR